MEATVGFTVKEHEFYLGNGYTVDELRDVQGPFGRAYYKKTGVLVEEPIHVDYVEYPWISCFEVSGISIENTDENQTVDCTEENAPLQ